MTNLSQNKLDKLLSRFKNIWVFLMLSFEVTSSSFCYRILSDLGLCSELVKHQPKTPPAILQSTAWIRSSLSDKDRNAVQFMRTVMTTASRRWKSHVCYLTDVGTPFLVSFLHMHLHISHCVLLFILLFASIFPMFLNNLRYEDAD